MVAWTRLSAERGPGRGGGTDSCAWHGGVVSSIGRAADRRRRRRMRRVELPAVSPGEALEAPMGQMVSPCAVESGGWWEVLDNVVQRVRSPLQDRGCHGGWDKPGSSWRGWWLQAEEAHELLVRLVLQGATDVAVDGEDVELGPVRLERPVPSLVLQPQL